jgi:hypothetical protein
MFVRTGREHASLATPIPARDMVAEKNGKTATGAGAGMGIDLPAESSAS